jgi:hypothetical protein
MQYDEALFPVSFGRDDPDDLSGLTPGFGNNADAIELDDLETPVRFHRQPRSLPAEQRVAYRLATLVLTLSRFNHTTASVESLNLISWATRTRRSRATLLSWWDGRRFADTVTERLDPNLPVTLNLAVAHGLAGIVNVARRRVALTEHGGALAARLDAADGLLRIEKRFLASLGTLSDGRIGRVRGKVEL